MPKERSRFDGPVSAAFGIDWTGANEGRPPAEPDATDGSPAGGGRLLPDGGELPDGEVTDRCEPGPSTDGGVVAVDEDDPAALLVPGGTDRSADDDGEAPTNRSPDVRSALAVAGDRGEQLARLLGERTVNVNSDVDEDAFFSGSNGVPTVVDRYDLERSVTTTKKRHYREVDRYWVNKPFAFAVVFHSEKENEKKYHVVEPTLTPTEEELREFLTKKLANSITYSWQGTDDDTPGARARVIEDETYALLSRYGVFTPRGDRGGGVDLASVVDAARRLLRLVDEDEDADTAQDGVRTGRRGRDALRIYPSMADLGTLEGAAVEPESAVLADGETTLTEYQVEKLLYYLRRDFIGFGHIDAIKHDVNVEDVSCDGYDSPVFVYHTDHEQLITNVSHGESELDDFVVKLAQRSGKSVSKRQPQVDATLPDGSRAQLTLGNEVSDRGTNYTIRQFKDVPYTPVDLVNWNTFSLEQVALLWLCIENKKSIMFAGGTASGKTTSLNALSLFIPSTAKIVSIEDTREVELPQRNWIASVTRPSFAADDAGDVDEFDLLEAALRQRPDYLVMGEVRGEEGRTLFQMMSTGHTTYTTFHADSVGEVIDRFTTDPISVSKSLFTALDLVTIQTETRVQGRKVRRNKILTEINHYDAEMDEINVQDVYRWHPAEDTFKQLVHPRVLEVIKFDRGWDDDRLQAELFKRRVLLAYLVDRNVTTYAEVAAAIQGFISDPRTILGLVARERLDEALADLRTMESVLIDIDPEKEAMVPRPDPTPAVRDRAAEILSRAESSLLDEYEDVGAADLGTALEDVVSAGPAPDRFDWNTDNGWPDRDGWLDADTTDRSETAAAGGSAPPSSRGTPRDAGDPAAETGGESPGDGGGSAG